MRRIGTCSLLLVALGCGASGLHRPAPSQAAPAPAAREAFLGSWDTTFGRLVLEAHGPDVTGSYTMQGAPASIAGRVVGSRLDFTYEEVDARGLGSFELSADGRAFTGTWREERSATWSPWNGERPVDASPRGFAGLWRTTYGAMRLLSAGETVRGTYEWLGRSTVVGRAEGDTLRLAYEEPDGAGGEAVLVLDPSAASFTGTWRARGGETGTWSGSRVSAEPDRTWLVILEAHWEGSLAEPEYSYGAMLRSYFTRLPNVDVRHRYVHDRADLLRFCRELAYLSGPIVLYISSHGTEDGISLGDATAGADDLIEALEDVPRLRLLHFGSCSVLRGDLPSRIDEARASERRFPISGFRKEADWGGSALVDFAYLELVLARGLPPEEAVQATRAMLSFACGSDEGPIPGCDLALHAPTAGE